ncbi:MAG: type I-F CRISPR-associated helicase Cas3f, partial [Burkholderiaceae bacterium]|nr:type I-F CRISPR-associated helicase Cas3f [Burkholderiaceae bacterium]
EGAVPTNTTARNMLRREDENDWHTAEDIRLLAQLAALLHDLGKASIEFQKRLRHKPQEKNLYRHEWVSLRLFQSFVGDDDDAGWLRRLADPQVDHEQAWCATDRYQRDGINASDPHPFHKLPPLAAAVAWLIVTHHRLPVVPVDENGRQGWLGKRSSHWNLRWLDDPVPLIAHDWNEIRQHAQRTQIEPYWQFKAALPILEPQWRAQAARLAKRLLQLCSRRDGSWLDNPYVMHLTRLCLMLADHHYSSLPKGSPLCVQGNGDAELFANTDRDGNLKQPLDEHLLGVARDAGLIAHALPGFERYLPRIANHRGLRKRNGDPRFAWQDNAFDAATALREAARQHGAFIVNMASTGCGKTLANARILYALADPQQGLRASYALGLRTLTLQTGRSYRNDLHLNEDELAIHVGGSASRALFEYYEQQAETRGSASVQDLMEEDSHVLYEGVIADHPLLSRALHDADIRKLLSAPMLVCTVDHLVPATESLRAGRQIAPMLRLLSADLVLDELDDYDLNDLPALTRLVHWAGMLGTRVVLSSATLPLALVEGMFMAYRAGRLQYRHNRGTDGGQRTGLIAVPCLWTDEFGVQTETCFDAAGFADQHRQFVDKRAAKLQQADPLRRAELLPLDIAKNLPEAQLHAEFARHVRDACLGLHGDHAETDPGSGKRVSFGIVRMANIDPLFDVARTLFELGAPEDTRIHLCVYHARFPLLLRSAIEHQLDSAFNRGDDEGQAVYRLPAIRAALDKYAERNHLFIVLASPVCEVGRDWDADWAVAEPSSMRALIQLAGRVQRHRRKLGDKPNVLIFDRNLKALEGRKQPDGNPAPVFIRPGFERQDKSHRFRLRWSRLEKLLSSDEYRILTALPRIRPRPESEWASRERLADLEQARIAASMLPRERLPQSLQPASGAAMERDETAWSWQYPQAALTGVLPQQQPFRDDPQPRATLVFLSDDDGEQLALHRVETDPARGGQNLYIDINGQCLGVQLAPTERRINPWGEFDLMALLAEQAEYLDLPLRDCARKLVTVEVPWDRQRNQGWFWHPWLGFKEKQ